MEKAKYQVRRAKSVRYTCVTTTRNTEDMINILTNRFARHGFPFKIIKIVNGEESMIFSNLRIGIVERRKLEAKMLN